MDSNLKKAIIDTEGDLLYTTCIEECAELIQALSKIKRDLYFHKDMNVNHLNNVIEEIGDVKLNIELIEEQLIRDFPSFIEDKDKIKNYYRLVKLNKLNNIFLKKENDNE